MRKSHLDFVGTFGVYNGFWCILVFIWYEFFHFGVLYKGKSGKPAALRGRCNDHNFLRFWSIFKKKLAFFSKTYAIITFFQKLAVV
jgi:hypothetical protein